MALGTAGEANTEEAMSNLALVLSRASSSPLSQPAYACSFKSRAQQDCKVGSLPTLASTAAGGGGELSPDAQHSSMKATWIHEGPESRWRTSSSYHLHCIHRIRPSPARQAALVQEGQLRRCSTHVYTVTGRREREREREQFYIMSPARPG